MWNLDEYCNLIFNSGRLRPLFLKMFDHWGDVLICLLINTSAPSHWLTSVAWPVVLVLKFRDIPDCGLNISYDLWPDRSDPVCWKVAVVDPRGASPPSYFWTKLRPEGPKKFCWETAFPPPPTPLISRSGSSTGLCLPNFYSGMDYVLWYWNDPELLPWSASLSLYSKSMHYEYQHCALVCLHECVLTPLRR